jgi:hypothetical protein
MDTLPIDNFTPILARGEPRSPAARVTSAEEFLRISREVEDRLGAGFRGYSVLPALTNAKDIVQKALIARIFREGTSPVVCSAGEQTAVVYPTGTVPGCEIRHDVLGELREHAMDFPSVWRSAPRRAFRKTIRAERCTCWHQCFLSTSIVRSPRMWPALAAATWRLGLRQIRNAAWSRQESKVNP